MKTNTIYTYSPSYGCPCSLLRVGMQSSDSIGLCLHSDVHSLPVSKELAKVFFFENNRTKEFFVSRTITETISIMFIPSLRTFSERVKSFRMKVLARLGILGKALDILLERSNYGLNLV